MTAIETLECRIDELCRENERLRGQVASLIGRSFRTADKMNCLNIENAKLRELVRFIMHQCNDGNPRCDECIDWNDGECVALLHMRELGLEVE